MSFPSGSLSFRRFKVVGEASRSPSQELLDLLASNVINRDDGMPIEEIEYGWSGGQHVLDNGFTFEGNVFGDAIHFALRLDTNKVPAELVRAWKIQEETAVAAANPSGFLSKNQKRDINESCRRKVEEEQRSGKHLKSKLYPALWDLSRNTIYCNVSSGNLERLMELFERTFKLVLVPLTAGSASLAELQDDRRTYEDLRPTRFTIGAEGESIFPEYPWIAKGPEPKDFLGNEFLLWLWYEADARTSVIDTESAGPVTIFFDRSLDLECSYGQTGKDSIRADGASRQEESRVAVKLGKVPRKAGLVIDAGGLQYVLTLGAEKFSMNGVKLTEVEEAESPRQLFEERVVLLSDLCAAIDGMFKTFLKLRTSPGWSNEVAAIRKWVSGATSPKPAMASA